MSFVEKIIAKEGGIIRLLTAQEDGKDAWYVISISPSSYLEYKKQISGNNVNLKNFGDILESGWGKLTTKLIEQLKAKYDLIA